MSIAQLVELLKIARAYTGKLALPTAPSPVTTHYQEPLVSAKIKAD